MPQKSHIFDMVEVYRFYRFHFKLTSH